MTDRFPRKNHTQLLMIPLPRFKTVCGLGVGMAACPVLRLLVTSSHSDLSVFSLPDSLDLKAGAFTLLRIIGGSGSIEPLYIKFNFCPGGFVSGYMAFTGCAAAERLLVVGDAGNDAVHVIDVVHGQHVGYVAAPGMISNPRGVASRGTKVAVSASRFLSVCEVVVYEGSGSTWTAERVIQMEKHREILFGLRFTGDGTGLVVGVGNPHGEKGCVKVIGVEDGSLVRTDPVDACNPVDVEDCGEHGWAVSDGGWNFHRIEFIGDVHSTGAVGKHGRGDGEFDRPFAMAVVPGLGLVVREYHNGGRLQLFATADGIAMAAMSISKTTWMMAVARAALSLRVAT